MNEILLTKIQEARELATDPGTIALLEAAMRHERWLEDPQERHTPYYEDEATNE